MLAAGDQTLARADALQALAMALLATARDDQAIAVADAAVGSDPAPAWVGPFRARAEAHRDGSRWQSLDELQRQCDALAAETLQRRTWRFASAADRFLHETLAAMVRDLEEFERTLVRAVEGRIAWAQQVQHASIDTFAARWEAARAAVRANPRYGQPPIDLRPQLGLVPIGENPATGLWEFYDLRSAQPPAAADAFAIPHHASDGSLPIDEGSGIVFILVPGGTFTMGATRDRDDPAFDARARTTEGPPHFVRLAPYLLSRYEMTQAQWERLSGGGKPSQCSAGLDWAGIRFTAVHPVETVSWIECDELLRRHGLVLPTEAQWEHAARADTRTSWWTGPAPESMGQPAIAENIADATITRMAPPDRGEPWDDQHFFTSPVGRFRANPWGFHDIQGNVTEWCREWFARYSFLHGSGDGEHQVERTCDDRAARGNCFQFDASMSRTTIRWSFRPGDRQVFLGVRSARLLE
jgi:formylglycine-generating enzyme required for sulfatase activity